MDELVSTVRGWAQRAKLQHSLRWLCFGLAVGLGVALLPALAARIWPLLTIPQLLLIGVSTASAGFLMALTWPWLRGLRTPVLAHARRFDNEFGLHQRISTALELSAGSLRNSNDELRKRQLADTMRSVGQVIPARHLPLRISPRDGMVAIGLLMALLLAILVPNDQQTALVNRALLAEQLQKEAQTLDEIKHAIENSTSLTDDQKTQALLALDQAGQELRDGTTTPEEAMAALNNAQDALDKLHDDAAEQRLGDLEHAGQNMTPDELTNALANSLANRNFDKAADQLRDLTNKNGRELTEEEQQRVANQLDQMARDVQSSDSKLSQGLREAAQNLREGNAQQAQQQLQQAADSLDKATQQDQASNALSDAQNDVSEARQRLTKASGKEQPGGQAGKGQKGQASKPGKDGDQSSDQFGDQAADAGGQTANGIGNGNATRSQHSEDTGTSNEVWAPERLGGDGQAVTLPEAQGRASANPNGRPNQAPGGQSSVPYQQVYADYAKTADDALQNGDVPAEYRDYIRDYFSSLNPKQNR